MPQRTELPFPMDSVADALRSVVGGETEPRQPGWHVSGLIKAAEELAKGNEVNPEDYWEGSHEEQFDENTLGMFAMGKLWEEASRPAFAKWCQDEGMLYGGPAQINWDGIVANADGVVFDGETVGGKRILGIHECKFRFVAETDPTKQDKWLQQTKAYCKMLGVRKVWFTVGNVKQRPPSSASRLYEVVFTEQEVDENWAMLVNTRDYLERMRGDTPVDAPMPADPAPWLEDDGRDAFDFWLETYGELVELIIPSPPTS